MRRQPTIELVCNAVDRDILTVRDDSGDGQVALDLDLGGAHAGMVYLNADSARELFNWLGVWLHTTPD